MMKIASMIVGALGALLVLGAIVGRCRSVATVTLLGSAHTASAVLLAANSILLVAILLGILALQEKK